MNDNTSAIDEGNTADSVPGNGQKRGKRRALIMDHARRLFTENGFHNVAFDDIARSVGIKREGIYYYFKSPTDILFEIVEPGMHQLINRLEIIVKSELHPISKLYLGIETHIMIFDRATLEAINISASSFADKRYGSIHTDARPLYKRYEKLWMDMLFQGEGERVINDFDHPRVVVFTILGMCNWMVRWFDPNGEASLEDLTKVFFSVSSMGVLGRIDDKQPDVDDILGERIDEIRAFKLVHGDP